VGGFRKFKRGGKDGERELGTGGGLQEGFKGEGGGS